MKKTLLAGLAIMALLVGGTTPVSAKDNCKKQKTEQCKKAKKHRKNKKCNQVTLGCLYNQSKDGVVNAYDKVADGTVQTYNKAANGAVKAYNKTKQGTQKAYNDVKDFFTK